MLTFKINKSTSIQSTLIFFEFWNFFCIKTKTNSGDYMKVLITGASGGIAFLTGITLASRDHEVIMTTHNEEQLNNLNMKLKSLNLNIKTFKLDITNKDDVSKFEFQDIDVLINHAGIGIGGSIIDLEIEDLRRNFEVNFFASYNLAKTFCIEKLNDKRAAKLIITSSIAGSIPFEFLGSYCSSKSAITMMARCLRKELDIINSNISVSVIEPGAYATGFNEVMIDTIDLNIKENSPFFDSKEYVYNEVNNKFKLIEKKSINSIVYQVVKAVEDKNNKFIYSAPLSQRIIKKIYLLLFG